MKLRRLDHAGIPVSDLNRSLRFYREVFGAVPEFVTEYGDPELSARLRIPTPRVRIAMIVLAEGLAIELLQYLEPVPKRRESLDCDVGAIHLCLEVDDIEESQRTLKRHGVDVYADPFLETEPGPFHGTRWLFFTDPDGITFELVQQPQSERRPT